MNLDSISSYCKSKGLLLPSSLIYGGFKGAFDYGPLGTQLKANILQSYWNNFLVPYDNIVSQEGSILLNEKVWEASGHLQNFNDPVAISESGERVRADHLIEEHLPNLVVEGLSCDELFAIINQNNILIENKKVVSVENANLMFSTKTIGGQDCYLRPETCQNIFVNAKLIADTSRLQLPFGICQHGTVFRNEIAPRNFVFRCREFEQLEMEFFFNPEVGNKLSQEIAHFEISCVFANNTDYRTMIRLEELLEVCDIHYWHLYWIYMMLKWLTVDCGLKKCNLRLREHTQKELSHYSSATFDIEYLYPIGQDSTFKELCGIANRGDYDVSQHAKFSKKNLKFKCPNTGKKLYPHVIEPSIGMERLFLAIICDAYEFDTERDYEVLHLKPDLCPVEYAIFPLPSNKFPKQQFYDFALKIQNELKKKHKHTFYDQGGSIGRRYARQDGIGTKWCITVDDISLEDNTVTIRDRDNKYQYRVDIDEFINNL